MRGVTKKKGNMNERLRRGEGTSHKRLALSECDAFNFLGSAELQQFDTQRES